MIQEGRNSIGTSLAAYFISNAHRNGRDTGKGPRQSRFQSKEVDSDELSDLGAIGTPTYVE
jgi:hypothetical protein